jgi:hypothetical protein
MVADSVEELKVFAVNIGLKKEWFQDKPGHPHFDLTAAKRAKAVAAGAIELNDKEYLAKVSSVSKCTLRWCKSGIKARIRVSENIGDGSFATDICIECVRALGIPTPIRGVPDLPEPSVVKAKLKDYYGRRDGQTPLEN